MIKILEATLLGLLFSLPTYAIIGGTNLTSKDKESHSVVAIYNFFGSLCTGTVIAPNYVLTAAHCVSNTDINYYSLRFGTNIFNYSEGAFQTREVEKIVSHESYSPTRGGYDIALIKFKGTLPQGTILANLPLADFPYDLTSILVVGYGMPSAFPEPIPFNGTGILRSVRMSANKRLQYIVASKNSTSGTSYGDSGGPAFTITADGKLSIIGIVNGSDNCLDDEGEVIEECSPYSYFANTYSFRQWILSHMQ